MNDATFNEAKQLYLEQYASAIVTGGYLKLRSRCFRSSSAALS